MPLTPAQMEKLTVPLDPSLATMLQAITAGGGQTSMTSGTPQESRALFRAITVGARDPRTLAVVRTVDDHVIRGPAGDVRIRIYRPNSSPPCPTLLYFHGGGFVLGDLDTQDDHARLLSRDLGSVVVSVDYRLAPEHPFPAGLEDCLAATRWVADRADELGGDPDRIAVSGDSAGANLATSVALTCAAADGPKLAAQLLLYPSVDFREGDGLYPSRAENGEGLFLTTADIRWFREQYLPDAALARNPRASVILADDLAGSPPTMIATGEYDPLRDEGEAYAALLERAGVEVVSRRYDGMIHGFFGMGVWSPAAAEARADICSRFRRLLGADSAVLGDAPTTPRDALSRRRPRHRGEPRTLVSGLGFPEDPRWHGGRLWFSDMAMCSVHTVDADGRVDTVVEVPGRPSGLGWRSDGTLLVVSMEDRQLLAHRDGVLTRVADLSAHATWHANDMVVDSKGRAYIGNFGFDFLHGEAVRPANLVRVDPDGSIVAVAGDLLFPNGAVLSPDESLLIVAETYGSRLTAFDVAPEGMLLNRRTFAQLEGILPDGICLDAEGAVWVSSPTTGEVLRVHRGAVVDRVQTGRRGAYACMLGGDDRRTLFICCAEGPDPHRNQQERTAEIQQLRVDVPGAGLP